MKHLQKQESFSFSTSSKIEDLFSDDEDGGVVDHNHNKRRIPNQQQNDYFEISLPPPSPMIAKTKQDYEKNEEFEFCFSFNSSSKHANFPTTPITTSNHIFNLLEAPITTSTQMVNVVDKKYYHQNKSKNSINYKNIFQKVSTPRCHQGVISPYFFRAPIDGQRVTMLHTFEENQRNSARLVGIRKFMVKLRSMKSVFCLSLNVPKRLQPSQTGIVNKKTDKTSNVPKLIRDYSHKVTKHDDKNIVLNTLRQNHTWEEEKSSRKKNFSGFSKMFDIITKNIKINRRSKQTGSKSCPVSIKSSPMHDHDVGNARDERRNSFYSRDHSIQAAIAHCKKSFGK